jgi:hypothetical protein
MRRLLCWLGVHAKPWFVDRKTALYFHCDRCGQVMNGDVTRRRS